MRSPTIVGLEDDIRESVILRRRSCTSRKTLAQEKEKKSYSNAKLQGVLPIAAGLSGE